MSPWRSLDPLGEAGSDSPPDQGRFQAPPQGVVADPPNEADARSEGRGGAGRVRPRRLQWSPRWTPPRFRPSRRRRSAPWTGAVLTSRLMFPTTQRLRLAEESLISPRPALPLEVFPDERHEEVLDRRGGSPRSAASSPPAPGSSSVDSLKRGPPSNPTREIDFAPTSRAWCRARTRSAEKPAPPWTEIRTRHIVCGRGGPGAGSRRPRLRSASLAQRGVEGRCCP